MSNPVFVRGLSRSGGTLMVTLLDSHPEIAMSYEQYPNLLELEDNVDEAALVQAFKGAKDLREGRDLSPSKRFGTYIVRYERGGHNMADFARHYAQILEEGLSLKTLEGRFRLVEIGCEEKMRREGKERWGMKFIGSYDDFIARWPNCRFINVLRDGRDVMASQINSMGGNKTPEGVAKGWASNHRKFKKVMKRHPDYAYQVRYEELVRHPEREIRALMTFLDIPFAEQMLQHDQQDLTIHDANHISGDRVASPIDDSKVGRWKSEMSAEQVEAFLAVAGDALEEFGYTS